MCAEMNWSAMRPLPRVAPWNKGRKSRNWEQRRDDYATLPKVPLIITAQLVTPILHAERERTHLDSILAFAALTNHPVASDYDQAAVIPLPLDLVWVSPQGLPLWACSPLMPVGDGLATREYWHKRYPSHRADFGDKLNAVTSAGRWKEYRVPVHAQQIDRLHALAIGHAEEIEALLAVVTHIGKKGSMGYGRVARWSVTPAAHTLADVLALRPVPVAYYEGQQPVGALALNRGWTAPYWFSPWWADCMVPA
jgi:CRISPR type IV-associated protein Csf3